MTPRRSQEYLRADLREMLLFIHRHTRRHGFGPTYSEIRDRMGYGSIGPVQYRLGMLQREGWISRIPGQARAIRVIRLPNGQSTWREQNKKILAWLRAIATWLRRASRRPGIS